MNHENLFKRFLAIFDELERIDKEHPIDSSEEVHPQVVQLIVEAKHIINELDPVIRVIYRDRPDQLSDWELLKPIIDSIEESNLNGGIPERAPSTQDEETDQQAEEMIKQGDKLITERLDPMAREGLRDHLEELAEWDRHMEKYYNLDKKDPDESDS